MGALEPSDLDRIAPLSTEDPAPLAPAEPAEPTPAPSDPIAELARERAEVAAIRETLAQERAELAKERAQAGEQLRAAARNITETLARVSETVSRELEADRNAIDRDRELFLKDRAALAADRAALEKDRAAVGREIELGVCSAAGQAEVERKRHEKAFAALEVERQVLAQERARFEEIVEQTLAERVETALAPERAALEAAKKQFAQATAELTKRVGAVTQLLAQQKASLAKPQEPAAHPPGKYDPPADAKLELVEPAQPTKGTEGPRRLITGRRRWGR